MHQLGRGKYQQQLGALQCRWLRPMCKGAQHHATFQVGSGLSDADRRMFEFGQFCLSVVRGKHKKFDDCTYMTDFWLEAITLTIPFTTRVRKGVSPDSDGEKSALNTHNKRNVLSEMNRAQTFEYSPKLRHLQKPKWSFSGQILHAKVTLKRREQHLWIAIIDYLNGQFSDGWGENGWELPGNKELYVNCFFPDCIGVDPETDRRLFH